MNSRTFAPQFVRFLGAGLVGLAVDIAVLYALAPALGWYAARVLSFLAAATTTWAINRRYAFQAQVPAGHTGWAREYARYLLSMTAGGAVNYATYTLLLHTPAVPQAPWLGVAAGSATGLVFNFTAARWWVFRRNHS
ncbi:GtrA family protein [Paracidovorax wautersii]|uniref:Flippase GtrA n=1 Tax=Paracidovorax wautersii TaxID=1177982 RepID=A0ABU1IAQ8_9BURK|nr:GtrA family protein [Paracidovorax wautersii]MDR6214293.1 putative flippase GtrA [Paracidovorax wautersii]